MSFIKLDTQFPGIVALFQYDPGVAKHISGLAQELMRRNSSLSIGERELIASFVSKMNECQFCWRSHAACASEFLGDELVGEVLEEQYTDNLSLKMQSLLTLSMHVAFLQRAKLPEAVAAARFHGASDQDIHDTVAIAALFCMCNRYVDGLGTTFEPGQEVEGGKGLAKYGYLMTAKRFFTDIVPKLWAKHFPKK